MSNNQLRWSPTTICVVLAFLLLAGSCESNGPNHEPSNSHSVTERSPELEILRRLPNGRYEVRFPQEGVPVSLVLDQFSDLMGYQFRFVDDSILKRRLTLYDTRVVDEDDLFAFLQVIFWADDLALVPSEDEYWPGAFEIKKFVPLRSNRKK